MNDSPSAGGPPSDSRVEGFIRDGYVRVDGAFPPDLAASVRDALWRAMDIDREDSAS